jgi:O-glycosyl hydrolase
MRLIIFFVLVFITVFSPLSGQYVIRPDPDQLQQKWQGWGISLAWWANIMGGWPDSQVDEIAKWITSPDELNMNVFRYNIGGGDNPDHAHFRKDGAGVPGYKPSEEVGYDWGRDANQRNILLRLNTLREDAINEAASFSPPYWMTKSGCSAGNTNGEDNLDDAYYDNFAGYLTDVVSYFKKTFNIEFTSLSPMNEPFSDWWKAMGGQEGCAFSQENQHRLVKALYKRLEQNNMLGYCHIAAMDANSIDESLKGFMEYQKAGDIMPLIGQINTHSYAGEKRSELFVLAQENGKILWQSESGPLNIPDTGMDNYLIMAQRIITDLQELKPSVWCDWQFAAVGDARWGLVTYNMDRKTCQREKSYYIRKQFTKFIKPGYTILGGTDARSLAALSADRQELVIVMVNPTSKNMVYTNDLSKLSPSGQRMDVFRTTENEDCLLIENEISLNNRKPDITLPPKSVTTILVQLTTQ